MAELWPCRTQVMVLSHKHGSVADDLRLPDFKPPTSPLATYALPQHETVEVFDVI